MNKQCKFQVGKYNCGSYAFNLYKEQIDQKDRCDVHYWQERAKRAALHEREACLKIISEYQIPVGSSSAGEIACEMTYGALKDIRDDITARGTT
jgi:hypothetical protein